MNDGKSLIRKQEITKNLAKKWIEFLEKEYPKSGLIGALESYISYSQGSRMYMVCEENFDVQYYK